MKEEIIAHLKELEAKEKLKILLAVESGSRAWGCPSPDSDYDVRIIYIREPNWYLSVSNKKDFMDYFHGALLDINGWDIRKALGLLQKSNSSLFEWNQSPIVYTVAEGFREDIWALSELYFQPGHTFNHYRGIAKNSYHSNLQEEQIKLKKLFYVLRPIFAATWVLEKESIPPMNLFDLFEIVKDKSIVEKVKELIKVKETANEDFVYEIDPAIKAFIESQFDLIDAAPIPAKKEMPGEEALNVFFRKLVNQSDF